MKAKCFRNGCVVINMFDAISSGKVMELAAFCCGVLDDAAECGYLLMGLSRFLSADHSSISAQHFWDRQITRGEHMQL